jgi:hypothetical protein
MEGDRGLALAEFAIVFPLLMVLLVGLVSAGVAWNQKLSLSHAAREGARYGATLPAQEGWATKLQDLVIKRAAGELTPQQVCVSLVQGSGSSPVVPTDLAGAAASELTTRSGGAPCMADDGYPFGDGGRRVQVTVAREGKIDIVFRQWEVDLSSDATARWERS